jgi:carbon storage regulator CsrA
MLVLSRKPQEQIVIPGLNIRLTILSVGTNRVHVGIDAPPDVQITRPDAHHSPGLQDAGTMGRLRRRKG